MYRKSVSIDVRDEVSIDVKWKISVDERVVSVDGGEWVSVGRIGVWINGGWRVLIDELAFILIDEERLSLWIERSKLAGSDENSSWVSVFASCTARHAPEKTRKKIMAESGVKN